MSSLTWWFLINPNFVESVTALLPSPDTRPSSALWRIAKSGLKTIALLCFTVAFSNQAVAQCCAGGSGSPLAGGASQGVLPERQVELNTNFQFIRTNKFYSKDSRQATKTFDSFQSAYESFRFGYGVTKNFTMSVETGYYFNKKEAGLNKDTATTYESRGIGDLILFPRYDIINWTEEKTRTELTLGLGIKIPLGSYNDSTGNIEPFSGQTFYVTKPQAVQLSSGAYDIIFYTFFFRGYTKPGFRIFANALYVRKGYNPNGEKSGDFASFGLFAGKTFFRNFGITLQARFEWSGKMKINEYILLFGKPSTYYPDATGYKKIFITPQLSYTKGKFIVYAASDFPVYQYLNSSEYYTQVGSEHSLTAGLSFRFFATRPDKKLKGTAKYYCPMHPEEISDHPNKCSRCGTDLEQAK